jgi:hypothetical protein
MFMFVGCLVDWLDTYLANNRLLTGYLPTSLHAWFILRFDGGLL